LTDPFTELPLVEASSAMFVGTLNVLLAAGRVIAIVICGLRAIVTRLVEVQKPSNASN
jgi:hypothetical protein